MHGIVIGQKGSDVFLWSLKSEIGGNLSETGESLCKTGGSLRRI